MVGRRLGMAEALFEYRCTEPRHEALSIEAVATISPITVFEGKWAYCRAGAAGGQKWEVLSPTALSSLRRKRVIRPSVAGIGNPHLPLAPHATLGSAPVSTAITP